MEAPGENSEVHQRMSVVYWSEPKFHPDGSTDIEALKRYLIEVVPNNLYKKRSNIWEPGKAFEVHCLTQDRKQIITFECVLNIKDGIIVCTACEPKAVTNFLAGVQIAITGVLNVK